MEEGAATLKVVHLHTSEEINDMVFVIYVIVVGSGTEVPTVHSVFCLAIETTHRQYGHRK